MWSQYVLFVIFALVFITLSMIFVVFFEPWISKR